MRHGLRPWGMSRTSSVRKSTDFVRGGWHRRSLRGDFFFRDGKRSKNAFRLFDRLGRGYKTGAHSRARRLGKRAWCKRQCDSVAGLAVGLERVGGLRARPPGDGNQALGFPRRKPWLARNESGARRSTFPSWETKGSRSAATGAKRSIFPSWETKSSRSARLEPRARPFPAGKPRARARRHWTQAPMAARVC